MSLRKNIIRIGDKVKIINPEIFQRVGYPLTKQEIIDKFTKDEKAIIEELMNSFGVSYSSGFFCLAPARNQDVFDRIADALAYGRIRQQGYGGKERKIYTKYDKDLLNVNAVVTNRKVVNTGIYNSAWGDEYDYEPAYLGKQQSHVILTVVPNVWEHDTITTYREVKIEKIHLEKI